MQFPFKIALRYIFTKRSFNFISVITFISLLGITVGVAALICVLSLFNGFHDLNEQQIIGYDPHLQIKPVSGNVINNFKIIEEKINQVNGIHTIAPLIQGKIASIKGTNIQVFTLNAIPANNQDYYETIENSMLMGGFKYEINPNLPPLLIGGLLSDRLQVLPGDTLTLMSPYMIESSLRTYRRSQGIMASVNGIYRTNNHDYDFNYGFIDFATGQKLFRLKDSEANAINIRLKNPDNVFDIKANLQSILPNDFKILTWHDLNEDIYAVMEFERMAAFTILSLIIIIALFNILASLSMTVVEKRRDIGALMAMGATSKNIRNIFLWEGSLIGFIATLSGSLLGIALVLGQKYYKWFKVDPNKFIVDAIPVHLKAEDVIFVVIVTLILTALATLYPAKRASQTVLISAIRSE